MKLDEQFGENSFDAVYAIEATCHAPNFEGIYGQIKKVLKPGGIVSSFSSVIFQYLLAVFLLQDIHPALSLFPCSFQFGVYEWCMTDAWDPTNPEHKRIAHGIEVGDGIPEMRSIQAARNALKTVGFEIEHEEDLADRGDKIPWYYPIAGSLKDCQTVWDYFTVARMTKIGRATTQTAVKVLETLRLVPQGTHSVGASLVTAADALVDGGRRKLFTPMMLFVCRKPKSN